MLLSSYSWSLGTCLSFLSGSILYIWPLTSTTLVFLQCVETEFFQLFVGRCLQKPRPAPVWRTRCRFKAYFIVRWGSRLYGQDKEIAGILGEGSFDAPYIFLLQTHRKPQLTTSFAFAMLNSFCYVVQVKSIVKPGCSQDVLKAALSAMSSVTETLNIMTSSSNGQTPFWFIRCHFPMVAIIKVRNSDPGITRVILL